MQPCFIVKCTEMAAILVNRQQATQIIIIWLLQIRNFIFKVIGRGFWTTRAIYRNLKPSSRSKNANGQEIDDEIIYAVVWLDAV